jgi:uncharacterized Zn finger protein
MAEIKLLPCPFCDGKAYKEIVHSDFHGDSTLEVGCKECGYAFDSVEKWNRRVVKYHD